jgi:hypothetical protein
MWASGLFSSTFAPLAIVAMLLVPPNSTSPLNVDVDRARPRRRRRDGKPPGMLMPGDWCLGGDHRTLIPNASPFRLPG